MWTDTAMLCKDTPRSDVLTNKLHSVALCYTLLLHVSTIVTRGYIHVSAG